MQTFKKLLYFLTPQERKHTGFLLVMILIMALLDTIGVASILPLIAVLSNPSLIETNMILNKIFQASSIFGVETNQQFLFFLGLLIFVVLVTSLAFKAFTSYLQVRFIEMRLYSVGKRLIEGYLQQPYSWFLNRNSADLGKTILSEVSTVIAGGLGPILELIARGLIVLLLIVLLITIDPKLAVIVGITLGLAYWIIYSLVREYLNRVGSERLKNNELRFRSISEAFGAAKEVKVGGLEQVYVKRFSDPAKRFAKINSSFAIISSLPRYFLEAIAFGGILIIILYLMTKTDNFNNVLPIISLYVFAGYRLMPAIQQVYASITQLTFVGPSIDKLYDDVKSFEQTNLNQDKSIISLNENITLKNVFYNYPNTSRTTIKDINLNIPAKTTVGIVGATGSGKTTTVDIILGLLQVQKGTLEVDGQIITKQNSRAWQRSIGYVPQHIFLSDDTIAANIAFGSEPNNIDQAAVEKASKIANLHEFVTEELPKQYQTVIGERGIRLSGGQRQRIGIARALYHNPLVLILDEATSSLDNETEKAVMDAVNNIGKDITIILIAHRLNTVKNCDIIFKLDKGQLVDQGTFDKIITGNKN
ncbi:ABC transporter ATP-binding protein/permease [Candidatus Pelagibacter bacterium]|nr:ABC transporter ATP-binding protein/permease [Candidatus Pelagibacter bacterium]